ncbi:MAG: AAA family ATPase [Leptolyngbyaceae cyanobacterium bins.302]|nr:AAA family ATPase [Leptolyngbyaceae cyanobacterium bins.302]
MRQFQDWIKLIEQNAPIVALEYQTPDRMTVLNQFYQWGEVRSLPVYVWNPGFSTLQQLMAPQGQMILQSTTQTIEQDILQFLLEQSKPGIYLLEGVLNSTVAEMSQQRCYQLLNAYHQALWNSVPHYWVLLETYVQLPLELQPFIPVLSHALPDLQQVQAIATQFCNQHPWLGKDDPDAKQKLVTACQGLPVGEIEMVLGRLLAFVDNPEQLVQLILEHKTDKLRGRGLEYIAEPDVPTAAGLDLLERRLEAIASLLRPEAQQYGLSLPTGMVLWGPPGTGKSLSAKLAAKKMGLPLLAANWGVLLSSANPDRALKEFIAVVTSLAPCVLYWDDFDKGFAGWDSNADGGIARRLSAVLLTWMQEHQEPIYTIATVNRLGLLPPELVRRFEDIFFVDLPHEGARYEVFNLHLAKYFAAFQGNGQSPWTDNRWRRLLTEYRICTPAEIGNAVRRCAEEAFYKGKPGQIELEDLLEQRQQFTPAMERESEQMQAIRNQATYARPASGSDRSRFAHTYRELFE